MRSLGPAIRTQSSIYQLIGPSINWLIDRLINRLIDWLIDWVINWSIDPFIHPSIHPSIHPCTCYRSRQPYIHPSSWSGIWTDIAAGHPDRGISTHHQLCRFRGQSPCFHTPQIGRLYYECRPVEDKSYIPCSVICIGISWDQRLSLIFTQITPRGLWLASFTGMAFYFQE